MRYQGKTDEYFEIINVTQDSCAILRDMDKEQLSLLWFDSDDNKLTIDGASYIFDTNQIVCLTEFHQLKPQKINSLKLLRFNRPFYCISNQDSEVGCQGILYFGAAILPIIQLSEKDKGILEVVWQMLCIEMESRDNLQLEMLQMMLKRILILCTRIYKSQSNYKDIALPKLATIRAFNFLVEQHFREKHTVAAYAKMLHKSPKTLANLFKKISTHTPLQLIKNRRMLEAKRLLSYTNDPISEIGHLIGFSDVQSFSRFFKKNEGISPSLFREALSQ